MARKKAEPAVAPTETEDRTRAVRLDLDERAHRLLRVVAAMEGVSMASYARTALERAIREDAAKRGVKI